MSNLPALPGELTPVSYRPDPQMTFEEFESKLGLIHSMQGSVMWWLGDLLNFGESKWGEKYTQALEATSYEYDTLARASYMAARFPPSQRIEGVSFSHYREVAALPPAEAQSLLEDCLEERLSVRDLRSRIRGGSGGESEITAALKPLKQYLLSQLASPDGDDFQFSFEIEGVTHIVEVSRIPTRPAP